ncbi:hypothetical protein AB0D67_17250 [Streptosporangium sp. NPDC048047]|uniref:hypothetical protein n=1 Tax=Streptosporangium sp. NPDC048047 TaxID=3155748 RepID=UPI003448CE67
MTASRSRETRKTSSSDNTSPKHMSLEELRALPVAVDLVTAGRAWGFGRTKSHELARRGEFPCPVLRIGNQYRVTRADLLRSLSIDVENVRDEEQISGPHVAA